MGDRFGYLQQDSGEPDLFVLPGDCEGFGGVIPPKGTRVVYSIGVDTKKHSPKAMQVCPEFDGAAWGYDYGKAGKFQGKADKGKGNGFVNGGGSSVFSKQAHHAPPGAGEFVSGVITKSAGKFGYLQQDSGDVDLFVLPLDCQLCGGEIPAAGTRVLYTIGIDAQKGRPKAEQVQLADDGSWPVRDAPY